MRFLLSMAWAFLLLVAMAVALMTGSTGVSAQTPTWVQWLVTSGHGIEDGRACGLVDPNEVDDLYAAVLIDYTGSRCRNPAALTAGPVGTGR